MARTGHAPRPLDDMDYSLLGPTGSILLIRVPWGLNHETSEPLRECVALRLPNQDHAGVVLDMAEVQMISSIGIAAMLQVAEHCRDRGASVVLAALPDRQRQFLRMLKIDTKFRTAPSVDEAVAQLSA